jgi:uncharacterized protein (DUF433 family)
VGNALAYALRAMARTITLRPRNPKALARLEERARLARVPKGVFAARYVEEGLAMDAYPGIVFRDGPSGRRPAIVGGPDVWEIIQVLSAEGWDSTRAADNLDVRRGLVDAALAYYADNQDSIDDWMCGNRMTMVEAAASFDRRRAVELA